MRRAGRLSAQAAVEFGAQELGLHAAPDHVPGLEASLAAAGFAFDRRPYVPHITLVRQARAAEPARFDRLDWPCREFVLVQSARAAQGARYEIIGRWGLAGAGPSR